MVRKKKGKKGQRKFLNKGANCFFFFFFGQKFKKFYKRKVSPALGQLEI